MVTPKKKKKQAATRRKNLPEAPSSHSKTVRRSTRVVLNSTKQTLDDIHDFMLRREEPDGIQSVEMADMKGFGVVATRQIAKVRRHTTYYVTSPPIQEVSSCPRFNRLACMSVSNHLVKSIDPACTPLP
jgi:hypothetical protein